MGAPTPTTRPADAAALADAVAAGDWPMARAALDALGDRLPGAALWPAAQLCLNDGEYERALRLLNRMIDRDPVAQMTRRYAANMAAMHRRDPAIAHAIEAAPDGDYQLAQTPDGLLTVMTTDGAGRGVCLSPDHDPRAGVRRAAPDIAKRAGVASPVALCGLGDGYLLAHLASHGPALELGAELAAFVIEPDAALLRVLFMIHDYAADDGPIRGERFVWCIGEQWATRYRAALDAEPHLAEPTVFARQSLVAGAIDTALRAAGDDLGAALDRQVEALHARYAARPADQWAALFSDQPPRRPRVLLLTTRFSTVLRHSTADAAAGFEQIGWTAQVFIEPATRLSTTPRALVNAIAEFDPDLIFQIDHLRHEHERLIPPDVPFACWVQDHLPNLADRDAGRRVGRRDFVLTAVAEKYVHQHGYPRGQCVPLGKLTRIGAVPATPAEYEHDITFVSNASAEPAAMVRRMARELRDIDAPAAAIAEQVGATLIETYDAGRCVHHPAQIDRMIDACDVRPPDAQARRWLVRVLFEKLNNPMYRQQALGWAARVAQRRELGLSLFGRGWAEHPRFAAFARGPVAYGEALQRLTRRSRINLQIVPHLCPHQRLLDGLVAGGFFLVRDHPQNALSQRWANLIAAVGPPAPDGVQALRDRVGDERQAELDALLEQKDAYRHIGDPVRIVSQWIACGLIAPGERALLPGLDAVLFDSEPGLGACIDRYIDDAAARHSIAEPQRRAVARRLSYAAGMKRVVEVIGRRLVEQGNPSCESAM